MWYPYLTESHLAMNKGKFEAFREKWTQSENITLSEIKQIKA